MKIDANLCENHKLCEWRSFFSSRRVHGFFKSFTWSCKSPRLVCAGLHSLWLFGGVWWRSIITWLIINQSIVTRNTVILTKKGFFTIELKLQKTVCGRWIPPILHLSVSPGVSRCWGVLLHMWSSVKLSVKHPHVMSPESASVGAEGYEFGEWKNRMVWSQKEESWPDLI